MKRIAIAILMFSIPAFAADPTLTGTWKLNSNIVGSKTENTCMFTQTGNDIKGDCKDANQTPLTLTGTIDDKGVHMTAKSEYSGTPLTMTYEATFADAKTINGSVHVQPYGVKGTFTLAKQ